MAHYEVKSKHVTIEFTNKFDEAFDAYRNASLPRQLVKITSVGNRAVRRVVEQRNEIVHHADRVRV